MSLIAQLGTLDGIVPKTAMSCSSGSRWTPINDEHKKCPKRTREPLLITGSRGGSGAATGWYNYRWLPEGLAQGAVTARDRLQIKATKDNLQSLIDTPHRAYYRSPVVKQLLECEETLGYLETLRFCERFLINGGPVGELPKTGYVVLKGGFDASLLSRDTIPQVAAVSKALLDSECDPAAYHGVLSLVCSNPGQEEFITDLIRSRGVTDAFSLERLLSEIEAAPSPIQSGAL